MGGFHEQRWPIIFNEIRAIRPFVTFVFQNCPVEKRRAHLLVLPRADARGAQEDGHGLAGIQRLLDSFLPRLTEHQVLGVQPRGEASFNQAAGEGFHRRSVGATVREKDVVSCLVDHIGSLSMAEATAQ